MGWKYEIGSWLPITDSDTANSINDYKWTNFYEGDSIILAFYHLFKLKLNIGKHPCVRFVWR